MDEAEIIIFPDSRGKRFCRFLIDTGDWREIVRFPSNRYWIQELYLEIIYRYGRVHSISYDRDMMYPPNIHFKIPKDKIRVLGALKFVKSKNRQKLIKLLNEDWRKFEDEVLALGLAETLSHNH